jgi:serine/threonine-protein kinase
MTATLSVSRESSPTTTSALERGASLGSYQLVLPIASGGMGRVWIAARRGDFGFQRMFAVKVMREDLAEDVAFRRMFLDEAKLASRLRHSNVVEVLDLGEVGGTVYQAMALIDGDSLAGLVKLAG